MSSPPKGRSLALPPKGSQPGAVGQVARLSETPVAFARLYPCGSETTIAFAGEKRVFLAHFPRTEVTPVSAVHCWGRAVVLLVSTSPCFCVLGQVLCAIFFALRRAHDVEMRNSSPCSALSGCEREKVRPASSVPTVAREKVRPASPKWPKNAVFGRAGRVFRGSATGSPVPGELFRGRATGCPVLGEFFRGSAAAGPHGERVVSRIVV